MNTRPYPANPVLVVDDDPADLEGLMLLLKSNGIGNVTGCKDSREVLPTLRSREIEVVLLDLAMPHLTGQELLGQIRGGFPQVPVIIITATDDVATAVECVKSGAYDYVVKIVEESRLIGAVERAIEARILRRDYRELVTRIQADEITHQEAFTAILTRDKKMQNVFLMAETVAPTGEPVLITGETGVGKSLVARAIHDVSGRSGDFVDVNVAGLDDSMFSGTLFGHRKGAFTGADEDRDGLVQTAAGGSLFLDEIGDLSIPCQIKLLKLLDTRQYYPLGSDLAKQADTRIIACTNRDLSKLIEEGLFRRDLYYRLCAYWITIPPLRERKGDLPVLCRHFVDEAARELGRKPPEIPPRLTALLRSYDFPGNIWELRAMIRHALSRGNSDSLEVAPFEEAIRLASFGEAPALASELFVNIEPLPTKEQAIQLLIDEALRRADNNKAMAAALLGISRQALDQWLRRRRDSNFIKE